MIEFYLKPTLHSADKPFTLIKYDADLGGAYKEPICDLSEENAFALNKAGIRWEYAFDLEVYFRKFMKLQLLEKKKEIERQLEELG